MKEDVSNNPGYKFPKDYRLHHRSLVEGLFRLGEAFYEFPFRVTWRVLSDEELNKNFRNVVPEGIGSLQMMVTVPKKKRKHAVDRVLMRRRIKEAYRLNFATLRQKVEDYSGIKTMSLGIVYIHDKNLPYKTMEEKMVAVLNKLELKIDKKEEERNV